MEGLQKNKRDTMYRKSLDHTYYTLQSRSVLTVNIN